MKELSIKEKAKRYDEALERAKEMIRAMTNIGGVAKVDDIQYIFQLKESEDEKIRNFIYNELACLRAVDEKGSDRYNELTEAIDWLEKQGEQKSVVKTQMVYPKFRIGDVISPNVEDGKGDYIIVGFNETLADYLVDGGNIPSCSIGIEFIDANFHIKEHKHVEHTRNEILSELVAEKWHYLINDCKLGSVVNVKLPFNWFDWLCRWFYASGEQSVEQKPVKEYNITGIGSKNAQGKLGEMIKNLKLVNEVFEQKPTWSDEDTKHFMRCKGYIEAYVEPRRDDVRWFKSLKDRVQPQNLTVTDEELAQAKKNAYNDALDKIEYNSENPTFDDGWSAAIWYLKKRNAIPQSQWKPSDEQMYNLSEAAHYNCAFFDMEILKGLYDDLKKLRENNIN